MTGESGEKSQLVFPGWVLAAALGVAAVLIFQSGNKAADAAALKASHPPQMEPKSKAPADHRYRITHASWGVVEECEVEALPTSDEPDTQPPHSGLEIGVVGS